MNIELIKQGERKVAQMLSFVIPHPQLTQIHQQMETLIAHAQLNRGAEKQCMPLIAPSNAGKSTIIRNFVERRNDAEALAEGRIPVLHVTLKTAVSKKSMVQDILYKLASLSGRDTMPEKGNENVLLERANIYLQHASVEILVLDEFHHVLLSKSEKQAIAVGETVKWMLINGPCPIVLSGTEQAWTPFRTNQQLVRRSLPHVPLEPLDISKQADRLVFGKFFGQYFRLMNEHGVAKNAETLVEGDTLPCLMEASHGIFGIGCKLLVEAVRCMSLANRGFLTHEDLSIANDNLILSGVCNRNSFREGLKSIRVSI